MAEQLLRAAGIRYQRRSEGTLDPAMALPGVMLLDSIGELAGLFPLADVVFMGGTLARRGGHNLLEPAICGKAIITGPHQENFAAVAAEFRENYAMLEIDNPGELAGSGGKADRKMRSCAKIWAPARPRWRPGIAGRLEKR